MSIEIKHLKKAYGALTVVPDVSFTVNDGEFISLLGPSGCGKTTTLRCIAGLEEASGGSIAIGGKVVSAPEKGISVPTHQRNIGMVFQSYAIWPHMTVAQNVGFPLKNRGSNAAEVEAAVAEALTVVELGHLGGRYPSELSGGQQQRVALARAIVGKPAILLFDEPLSNLDAKLRESTRLEIRRIQKHLNVAAVYVTHDQEEALSMSDRIIVMNRGEIQQIGKPQDLYRNPANRFVADFVGKASFLEVTREGSSGLCTKDGMLLPATIAQAEGVTGASELMLRPEIVDIARDADPASGKISVRGQILAAQYLGAVTEYHVAALGGQVKVTSTRDYDVGSEVALSFAAEDARLVAV
ncbi:ABC transporter ATP-binding protein [Paracoccus pantotrophus]|uniref:Putative ABC transporter n=1 Tax=Paracoccus pantotrophus TaxID=82367 RepID=Q3S8F8_PARPN|nr:ABC transporter ATP-binding protein [Paracoccus pantotrophus]AAZ93587.1 putative ABC transporter [Paracoccus pantotrophus]RDD96923.1 ABC transporter ATP-binding protein [Paracoccus pantotrophus]WGR66604.1 ABC transporter ATP-binding protein [Paracoccus pantotrophus]